MVFPKTIRHPAKTPDVSWIYTREVNVKCYNPPLYKVGTRLKMYIKAECKDFSPQSCDLSVSKMASFTFSF